MRDRLALALMAVAFATILLVLAIIVAAIAATSAPNTVKLRSACDVDQGRHHLKGPYYSEVLDGAP